MKALYRSAHLSGFARSGVVTVGFTAATLVANLLTGLLISRQLGPTGRGQFVAALNPPQVVGVLLLFGCAQAVSYRSARRPDETSQLLGTWLLIMLPLGLVGIVGGEVLLPVALKAQEPWLVELARPFMLLVIPVLAGDLSIGLLLGNHDFWAFNLLKVLPPWLTLLFLLMLWHVQHLSTVSVLLTTAVGMALGALLAFARVLSVHGLQRPNLQLGRSSLWYGLRAHGTNVVALLNGRLDLLVMPAFLTTSSVGLYSVATNVSWLPVTLIAPVGTLLLPVSARAGRSGLDVVGRTVRWTLVTSCAVGVLVAVVARTFVPLLYGPAFAEAVLPLLILLPGCVLYTTASILWSALNGANHPLAGTGAQLSGLAVTAIGLPIFLPAGGILAAAVVSTVSYLTIFVASLLLYGRYSGNRPLSILLPSSDVYGSAARILHLSLRRLLPADE